MAMYTLPEYDEELFKQKIIEYMWSAFQDLPRDRALPRPKHSITAEQHLLELRIRDPENFEAMQGFHSRNLLPAP